MQMLRARLITFVLTVFVGLGLVSLAFAHPLPTGAEVRAQQELQALQAVGVSLDAICGQWPGKSSCPDHACPICPGGSAVALVAFLQPGPVFVPGRHVLALPPATMTAAARLLLGHRAQGPPACLI